MDPMELAARVEDLIAWIQANEPYQREDLTEPQVRLLRRLTAEFQHKMYMVLPPGTPCPYCDGTGIQGER